MARILAISSQVVHGPVGNTAAVPPMLAMGHEVMQLPTIILSHHPGHGAPVAQRMGDEIFAAFLTSIEQAGALAGLTAVMTGYFASPGQVHAATTVIERARRINPGLHVLVDPVMGDDGKLYVDETVAQAIRDSLLPLATIATPNAFELGWLTGMTADTEAYATAAARTLTISEVLATSIPVGGDRLATLLVQDNEVQSQVTLKRNNVPHGTGDFLAGSYLAARLGSTPANAFVSAMQKLETAIAASGNSLLHVTP